MVTELSDAYHDHQSRLSAVDVIRCLWYSDRKGLRHFLNHSDRYGYLFTIDKADYSF